jgi:hypothetical protein
VGAFGRLVHEGVVPLVKRAVEIAYELGLLPNELNIDDFILRVEVRSPMAMARQQMKSESILQYLQIVGMVYADQPGMVDQMAHRDRAIHHVGKALMVPEDVIPTAEEREKIAKQQAEAQAAQVAAAAAMADPAMAEQMAEAA